MDPVSAGLSVSINRSYSKIGDTLEKITSGNRLTTGESPADIGVSSRLSAQYNENFIKARNAQDAISYLQTREGVLENIGGTLYRLRELAIQYKNPILNESDRKMLVDQANMLKSVIDDTAGDMDFNGHSVAGDADAEGLGLDDFNLSDPNALIKIDNALGKLNSARVNGGTKINALESEIDGLRQAGINLAKANERLAGVNLAEEISNLASETTRFQLGVQAQKLHMDLSAQRAATLLGIS
ncbi:flagellin [Limisalsivibrio acetivorans]|uniref:flagellin n=1 Tax=Limisalsivibrio acetivorans TaxID=1304888 RepID=UPI00138AB432|nr:flagellin [Limisalsivibrio acetivorans]